jgi:hypothetical protein
MDLSAAVDKIAASVGRVFAAEDRIAHMGAEFGIYSIGMRQLPAPRIKVSPEGRLLTFNVLFEFKGFA